MFEITTFPPFLQIFRRKSYQQPLHPTLYALHRQLRCPLNQPSLHKKRRSPALYPFVLGCQCAQRILPTQTKDYHRIVNNSYLATLERSPCVRHLKLTLIVLLQYKS